MSFVLYYAVDVVVFFFFFFQAEDGIRDYKVTGVQTCALPICVRDCFGFLPAYPLMLGADQREAVVGAGHRGMLRHLANSSSLAFCMRSAASVSLRSLDCRASRSAVIPGFKYFFHFFNDTSFS